MIEKINGTAFKEMVLFGAACVIYFVINFTLSCVVRSMQNRRKKALVFAPAKAA